MCVALFCILSLWKLSIHLSNSLPVIRKESIVARILKKSKDLQTYTGRNGVMKYFNLVGVTAEETVVRLRFYQVHRFTTLKLDTTYKFSGCVKKDETYWIVSGSSVGFTAPVTVPEHIMLPALPEDVPPTGLKRTLQMALQTPERSTVQAKIVKVCSV